jgi:hypothetical protein
MHGKGHPTTGCVYRTMLKDEHGRPICGVEDFMLGVRLGIDVHPENGVVRPGHGMSAVPDNPIHLQNIFARSRLAAKAISRSFVYA